MVHKINYDGFDYPHDVERIMKIASAHGLVLTPKEAEAAWQKNSDMMAAGWLSLPDDDESVWNELPASVKYADEDIETENCYE